MFENPEVQPGDLPKVDSVEWQPMDRKFIRRKIVDAAVSLSVVVAGLSAANYGFGRVSTVNFPNISIGWLWIAVAAFAVLSLVWPSISVPRMSYAVRERDIIYKNGVFWQTVTAIPFNRIQHVEKSSTPLDRRFRISTLQLFTAGGSGGDLSIHGLSAKTAEKLRFFILEKIGSSIE